MQNIAYTACRRTSLDLESSCMKSPMPDEQDQRAALPLSELQERVIYSLLLPAVRMARVFNVPLRQMGDSLHMAYFHELKDAGFKMRQAAVALEVSMRKVALLSKQLKENFFRPEREAGLPRRIEFALWAEPLSQVRIEQCLPEVEPDAIDAALHQLLDDGRIVMRTRRRTDVYQRSSTEARLVTNDWHARIDALNNLLGNVCHAVYGRFFADDARAFARTLTFRIREQDLPKLHDLYQNVIYDRIKELEAAAKDSTEFVTLDLSVCWAPYQYLTNEQNFTDESETRDDTTDEFTEN